MASRHRRSILGSIAVLVLVVVVIVSGLFGGGGSRNASEPPVLGVSTAPAGTLAPRLVH